MTTDADPADVATDLRKLVTDQRVQLVFDEWAAEAIVVSGSHYQPATLDEGQFSAGELWADFEVNESERARLELPGGRVQIVAKEYRVGMWRQPTAAVRQFLYDEDDPERVVGEEWDDLGTVGHIERETDQ